jgi:peptidoglycan/xylan/chitin deacetylase (PgdA/CDA1 family)
LSYILWKSGRASETERWRAFARENRLSADGKQELLERLASETRFDIDLLTRQRLFHLMTPHEAAETARRGVDIQLHTHRHRTPMEPDKFWREIDDNRRRIEEIAGRPARHFCYPSGVYHANFFPWLREHGVISATTCEPGFTSSRTEPMCTPRLVDVTGLNDDEFEGWLCGVSAAFPRRASSR